MNSPSKTDWQRVKQEAETLVAFDPALDPYDPNDPAAVAHYWQGAAIKKEGQTLGTVRRRGPNKNPVKQQTAQNWGQTTVLKPPIPHKLQSAPRMPPIPRESSHPKPISPTSHLGPPPNWLYNLTMITWDENKRAINLTKHGLDLADAGLVYFSPNKVTLESPRQGEQRWMDMALVEVMGVVLALAYVLRDGQVHAISLRRASRAERNYYEFAQQNGLAKS